MVSLSNHERHAQDVLVETMSRSLAIVEPHEPGARPSASALVDKLRTSGSSRAELFLLPSGVRRLAAVALSHNNTRV